MEEGRPAAVIAQVAEREGAGLIVVGRRGRGMVAKLMFRSVSHELTQQHQHPSYGGHRFNRRRRLNFAPSRS
jgi:universal stress protein family protein